MTTREPVLKYESQLLVDFKSHIRITSDDLDAELRQKLLAAVFHAEHHIGQVILLSRFTRTSSFAQTVTLKVPVVTVEGLEVDGNAVTDYSVTANVLTVGPSVQGTTMTVTYTAGYDFIPFDMKAAILMHAASLFNNPTDSVETLTKASQNLLRPYRSWGLDNGEQD